MPVYAIGDVQGCYEELTDLLTDVDFDSGHDRLWFAGDLVNRGPRSLEVLRFVRDLGDSATTVLGNHDLHLLAVSVEARPSKAKDTFDAVLAAPDAPELLDWLRSQPLVHRDESLGFAMVHAGIPARWTVADAISMANEVEQWLRSDEYPSLLANMYGKTPDGLDDTLPQHLRARYIMSALTRMRFVDMQGRLDTKHTGPPGSQPKGLTPWYAVEGRASAGENLLFGHWATLRLAGMPDPAHHVYALDTGCVWGGDLTAFRLDDSSWHRVASRQPQAF